MEKWYNGTYDIDLKSSDIINEMLKTQTERYAFLEKVIKAIIAEPLPDVPKSPLLDFLKLE